MAMPSLLKSFCEFLHINLRLATYYIPVRHDMMRQTNDCSPVRVIQHKVKYFPLFFSVLETVDRRWSFFHPDAQY